MFDLTTVLLLPFAVLWMTLYAVMVGINTAIHLLQDKSGRALFMLAANPCIECKAAEHCALKTRGGCPRKRLAAQGFDLSPVVTRLVAALTRSPALRPFYQHGQRLLHAHQHVFRRDWLEPRLTAITGAALLGSFIGAQLGLRGFIISALDLISFGAGAYFATKDGLVSLRRRQIDVDLLMVLFALGTALIGYWNDAALLLFLFSLSHVLQDFAVNRNRSAIESLIRLHPDRATVLRDGQPQLVEIRTIQIGDMVRVRPGARLPVDGVVRSGGSFLDQSAITGESLPVWKHPGELVYAGSLNQHGALDIEVMVSPDDTLLARIIKRVEEAHASQSQTESFVKRFERRYSALLLVGGALITLLHLLAEPNRIVHALQASMVLMTVASPCALTMSAPTAYISAIASAARRGVLFKGSIYLEQLAKVSVVVFDKTGTLTSGSPVVTDVVPASGWTTDEALKLAAALESRSEHPLAKAILDAARQRHLPLLAASDFEAIPGQGVRACFDGRLVELGRPQPSLSSSDSPFAHIIADLEEEGKTVIALRVDGAVTAVFALADTLRHAAPTLVADLRALGLHVVMLTGDNLRAANSVARRLGIDTVYAELLPENKVTVIEQIQAEFGPAMMLGDGINDAPALTKARVGMAMGQTGTAVTLETADVVLMADRLELVGDMIRLSRAACRVVWQNIIFALAGMILLVVVALLTEDLPLPLAVLGHEGGTVLVVLNSLVTLLLWPAMKRKHLKQRLFKAGQELFYQSFRAVIPHG